MQSNAELSLSQLLRIRPAYAEAFEKISGPAFWSYLNETLSEFCRAMALEISMVQYRLSSTLPAATQEDWLANPLCRLVDHLTQDHLAYRLTHLPRIESLLTTLMQELGPGCEPAKEAQTDFRSFRQEFHWHMEEEESFLFPKIMRTEACLHHPELSPEIFKGSVKIFPPSQIQKPEEAFREMLASLNSKAQTLALDPVRAAHLQELLSELSAFGSKIKAHTDLETEILFPRATGMEAELRKRAVQMQNDSQLLP